MSEPESIEGAPAVGSGSHGGDATPWWRSKVIIMVLGLLAASIAPVNTAVQVVLSADLERTKNDRTFYLTLLDRGLDAGKTIEHRRLVLKYLLDHCDDQKLAESARWTLDEIDENVRLRADLEAERLAREGAIEKLDRIGGLLAETEGRLREEHASALMANAGRSQASDELERCHSEAQSVAGTLQTQIQTSGAKIRDLEKRLGGSQAAARGGTEDRSGDRAPSATTASRRTLACQKETLKAETTLDPDSGLPECGFASQEFKREVREARETCLDALPTADLKIGNNGKGTWSVRGMFHEFGCSCTLTSGRWCVVQSTSNGPGDLIERKRTDSCFASERDCRRNKPASRQFHDNSFEYGCEEDI